MKKYRKRDFPVGNVRRFLEPGPIVPVIMNWACGNRSPSMLMNGIDPPRPANIAGLPKYVADARWIDSSSFGSVAGAFQPLPASPYVFIVTRAPYGGSASTISLSRRTARPASHVGGRRSEILSVVCGRSTLPPSAGSGIPAAPVIASAGRHVLFRISSYGSVLTGWPPGGNGKRS